MATPLTHDQWLKILRAEGVRVEEYPGWRTRGRDAATGLAFGPVRMFLNHHTAGRNSRDLVAKNGIPGLPAPLAHIYLAKSGVATMCSAGRANHAGPMAVNAYQSFRDEKTTHPAPSRASGTIDGNDVAYGIETENLGDNKDVYPRAQYDAWVRINAAVCRHHGWTAESVGCHKETSVEGKVDPRGPVEGYGSRDRFEFTPERFRADVDERLKHPASWSPDTATSTPAPSMEDDMALTEADIKKIAKTVLTIDGVIANPNPASAKKNSHIALATSARNIEIVTRRTETRLAALQATVDKLVGMLGTNVDTKTVVTAVEKAIADAVIKVDIDVTGPDAK